ncbi:MAG: hypothetical protein IT544_05965 [Rhodobacteraceae bacterium]|jgi:hypothetical protein|nr:hypothetical protein [Paracoccaceae bacterium]
MSIGHRGAEKIDPWGPSAFMVGINNFLMLLFFYLYAASETKVAITRCIRHLQLAVIKTWNVATFW